MRVKEILERWASKLSEKLNRSPDEILERGLSAYDFPSGQCVEYLFDDGSVCKFNNSFVVLDLEKEMVGIFTEHCGYHEFSSLYCKIIEGSKQIYFHEEFEG